MMGLHPRFFIYKFGSNQQHISIEAICPYIMDSLTLESLEHEGSVLAFSTRDLLQFVDLEQYTNEEIAIIKSKLCETKAYVQMKRFRTIGQDSIMMFRII